jgi:hypothetical protein
LIVVGVGRTGGCLVGRCEVANRRRVPLTVDGEKSRCGVTPGGCIGAALGDEEDRVDLRVIEHGIVERDDGRQFVVVE